ncbi:MAG: type II toxin-antitoxin system prevent-host-death family antitoxin [Acidobacteriota bacterium]
MTRKQVSIRELKSRLSHYIRLARSGESILITDRGVPVGRIVPLSLDLKQRIDAMCDSGAVAWNGNKLDPGTPVGKRRGSQTVADILIAERK